MIIQKIGKNRNLGGKEEREKTLDIGRLGQWKLYGKQVNQKLYEKYM